LNPSSLYDQLTNVKWDPNVENGEDLSNPDGVALVKSDPYFENDEAFFTVVIVGVSL